MPYLTEDVTYKDYYGVVISVFISVTTPEGVNAEKAVLYDAAERAIDKIMDEGLDDVSC